MTEVQKLTNNKEIIAYLAEKFPLCFSLEGEAKPLKIGLFQDLSETLKDDERVSKHNYVMLCVNIRLTGAIYMVVKWVPCVWIYKAIRQVN